MTGHSNVMLATTLTVVALWPSGSSTQAAQAPQAQQPQQASQASPRAEAELDRDLEALRRQSEQRFDVLPLTSGLALRPKFARNVRSIEIINGAIAVDGTPVTAAELRDRIGADGDLVIRLSFLDESARRQLFRRPRILPRASHFSFRPNHHPRAFFPVVAAIGETMSCVLAGALRLAPTRRSTGMSWRSTNWCTSKGV